MIARPFRKTVPVTIACFPILYGSSLKQGGSYGNMNFHIVAIIEKVCECLTDALLVKVLKKES